MNRQPVHTADTREKKFGVTTRACTNSEPAYVVYQGVIKAESVALFYDQDVAEKYVKWRNKADETAQ